MYIATIGDESRGENMESELELHGYTPAQASEILEAVRMTAEGMATWSEMVKKIAKVACPATGIDADGKVIPID